MKRFLFLIGLVFCFNVFAAATPWEPAETAGSQSPSDIDAYETANNDAIERLVSNYQRGAKLAFASTGTFTVTAGEIAVSNSGVTDVEFLQNTTDTTVSWTSIDTDTEASSTIYYVYGYGSSSADTFSVSISKSPTAPTAITQYKLLGSFYNGADGHIDPESIVGNSMAIVTGTVAHGGTIPLPTGYDQGECKWMVSPYSMKFTENGHDSGSTWTIDLQCRATADRVVTTYSSNPIQTSIAGTANYIIIGKK